ncbi:DNA topoisomerase 4 subunit A [compost metagenome]
MQVRKANLRNHIRQSWVGYARYTIEDRALPDIRDGLKPVHRRILYILNRFPNISSDQKSKFIKSAKAVGEVMGNLHPHGDSSIYNAMLGLGQSFTMNYPLLTPKGNWGDVLGNPAAAMRYTEVKPATGLDYMMTGFNKNIVPMVPNFDGSMDEPVFLPSMLPNLLINGSMGIATGINSIFLPHNVDEAINACITLLDNPNATLDDVMTVLSGPDFPTGGTIINANELRQIYETGRGAVTICGDYVIEKNKITINNLPYKTTMATLKRTLGDLAQKKQLPGVRSIPVGGRSLTIVCESDADPEEVLTMLRKRTGLETTFTVSMKALDNGSAIETNLVGLINRFLEHRREMIVAELRYDLAKTNKTLSELEAIKFLAEHREEVLAIIDQSDDKNDAAIRLAELAPLTGDQIQYILGLSLHRLLKSEVNKTILDIEKTNKKIAELTSQMQSADYINNTIRAQLIAGKNGVERKTMFKDRVTPVRKIKQQDDALVSLEEQSVIVDGEETSSNSVVTILLEDGTAQLIRAGKFSEKDVPENAKAVYYDQGECHFAITNHGVAGTFVTGGTLKEEVKIPLSGEATILDITNKTDFTHAVLITNLGNVACIPKEELENGISPIPVLALQQKEFVQNVCYVDNTDNKYAIFAINEIGEYFKTDIVNWPWIRHTSPLEALPFSKSNKIMVQILGANDIVEPTLSNDTKVTIDLSRFVSLSRDTAACKYKLKLASKTKVLEV